MTILEVYRRRGAASRARSLATAAAVLIVLAALASIYALRPDREARAQGHARQCVFTGTHAASPLEVPLDGAITITLGLQGQCPSDGRGLHVVLVVDASEQMKARSRDWLPVLLSDAESALQALPPESWADMRVGVVSFRDRVAETEAHLTDDREVLVSALHDIAVSPGEDCIECGLREGLRKARRVLQAGRGDESPEEFREVIILASRGFETTACEAVRAATNEVKPFGMLVVTACGGGECDRRCLAEAATSESFAFASNEWGYLGTALRQLLDEAGPFNPIESVGIVDELSEMLLYTSGGDPSAAVGNRLEWHFSPWPSGGITRTYAARAVGAGLFPLSSYISATVQYNSDLGAGSVKRVGFDNPIVRVVPPTPTSSPTPTPDGVRTTTATLTPAQSPSATWTPRIGGTPSATPTRDSGTGTPTWKLHLPLTLRHGCAPRAAGVDVALVIDVSGSMAAADVDRMSSRWAAAASVAESVVTYYLAEPADRAAVIPFAERPMVRSGLDDGLVRARQELNRLPKWNGSRMDLAITAAQDELLDEGRAGHAEPRPGSQKVIVLFTDGDLNMATGDELLRSASAARESGIRIVAVVLGRDARADLDAMRRITGSGSRVLTSEDLSVLALGDAVGRLLRCRR